MINGMFLILEIVNIPFLDGDVHRSPSVDDFNNRNLFLTAKLLKQGYRYHEI